MGIGCFLYEGYYYWTLEFSSKNRSATATAANNSTMDVAVEVEADFPVVEALGPEIHGTGSTRYGPVGTSAYCEVAADRADSFQWYSMAPGSSTWQKVSESSGTTAKHTFTLERKHNGCRFKCIVSNQYGSAESEVLTILVCGQPPAVLKQPKSVSVEAGKTAEFTVEAICYDDIIYQWKYRKSADSDWDDVDGAESPTLRVIGTQAKNGYQYRCCLSAEYGITYSDAVTLTVLGQSAATYTVTLDPNGGTCSTGSKTVVYGSAYGTLPTPTRTGYTFAGWWTAKDSGGKQVTKDTVCYATGNYTLYARWTAKSYTVTLDANGGSCSKASMAATYGKAYGTLPTPTRTGYTFKGWWTTKDSGGKQVTASTVCYATGNYTLYARWTAKTYTVTLDANGGSCSKASMTATYGKAYGTLLTPTRTGYTFKGWWTAKDSGGKQVTASTVCYATGNYTLYARWTAKTYTVTLNPNGGSCSKSSITATYGKAYGTLPTPTRTGYTFKGWWTAKDSGGKQVTASTVCYATGNYTLYARWTIKTFTVTLNANGGSCSKSSITATYGKAYGTLPTPTRRGYKFAGWWTAKATGGKQVTASTVCQATGNFTLYARWTALASYTVTLNPNGGTCSKSSITVYYSQAYGTLPTPTRTGYTFAGWWTTKSGDGKQVKKDTVCYATGNYTLYARWTAN